MELHPGKVLPKRSCAKCKRDAVSLNREAMQLHHYAVQNLDALTEIFKAFPPNTPTTPESQPPPVLQLRKLAPNRKRPAKARSSKSKRPTLFHPFGQHPKRSPENHEISLLSSDDENESEPPPKQDKIHARPLFQILNEDTPQAKCIEIGCSLPSQANGLCEKHAKVPMYNVSNLRGPEVSRCKAPNCTLMAGPNEFCFEHNLQSRDRSCAFGNCSQNALYDGLCPLHSKLTAQSVKCSAAGCTASATPDGFCAIHSKNQSQGSSNPKCKEEGCQSAANLHGYCNVHVGLYLCRQVPCKNLAIPERPYFCAEHLSAQMKTRTDNPTLDACQVMGCTTTAKVLGYCRRHYNLLRCKYQGCTVVLRQSGNFCEAHDPAKAPNNVVQPEERLQVCKELNCNITAHAHGYCRRHFSVYKCHNNECTALAEGGGEFCSAHAVHLSAQVLCKVEGCSAQVDSLGFCRRHLDERRCKQLSCGLLAENGIFCAAHVPSVNKSPPIIGQGCTEENCKISPKFHGYCRRHYLEKKCNTMACKNLAEIDGKCVEHSQEVAPPVPASPAATVAPQSASVDTQEATNSTPATVPVAEQKLCKLQNCQLDAKPDGYCNHHSSNDQCRHESCSMQATKDGFCEAHASIPPKESRTPATSASRCKKPHCSFKAKSEGFCQRHYLESKKSIELKAAPTFSNLCQFQNCLHVAKEMGRCVKHLPEAKAQAQPTCKAENCSAKATANGLCDDHGTTSAVQNTPPVPEEPPKDPTLRKAQSCKIAAKTNGYCRSHYIQSKTAEGVPPLVKTPTTPAAPKCLNENCAEAATEKSGLCKIHDDVLPVKKMHVCKHEGCTLTAKTQGYCRSHFSIQNEHSVQCKQQDCTRNATSRGYCSMHLETQEKSPRQCKYDGCNIVAKLKGYCRRHGLKLATLEEPLGNANPLIDLSVDSPTGSSEFDTASCSVSGCSSAAVIDGLCQLHYQPRPATCRTDGCSLVAKKQGFCARHFHAATS
ncbi:hypothetical protein AC1031_019886 [Aphanomyces cochlioides]|nr:hypothetical protein AC1031_019886 [Aphanomyces cochlioides]